MTTMSRISILLLVSKWATNVPFVKSWSFWLERVHIQKKKKDSNKTNLGIICEPINKRSLRALHSVAAVRCRGLPRRLNKHLNLTNSTHKLRKIVPCQSRSRYFELLSAGLWIINTLSQDASRRIEAFNKRLPIQEILSFVATLVRISITLSHKTD